MSCAIRPLNLFEDAECRVDGASSKNLNFSIVSSYKGSLNASTVQEALKHLQKMHPLLRMSPNTTEKITAFIETSASVPFRELNYQNGNQWRSVVKEELKPRFNKIDQPFWRICLLKGENEGHLIVTFHHAIADGVCGMPVMDHLYRIMSLILNRQPIPDIEFNDIIPDHHTLYDNFPSLESLESVDDAPVKIPEEKGLEKKENIQDFLCDVVEEITTRNVITWSKVNNIKIHAILFAALLMAVRDVLKPDFDKFLAVTAVNYRSFFKPPFSKEALGLMRTRVSEEFTLSDHCNLKELAKAINTSVHSQLDSGKHILNLKALEKRLQRNISPEELLQRNKFPGNAVIQTNVGTLEFSGDYPHSDLSLKELFFYADVSLFSETPTNVVLGVLTFRQKIFLSLWFLEKLVKEVEAKEILTKMKKFLVDLK